jgi:uncharacterized repeat protein (TIGR03806 family)
LAAAPTARKLGIVRLRRNLALWLGLLASSCHSPNERVDAAGPDLASAGPPLDLTADVPDLLLAAPDLAMPDLAMPDLAPAFGLDFRPANPTCIAPARPVDPGSGVMLKSAFPGVGFIQPVKLLQAPGDTSRWFVVRLGGTVMTFPNDPNTSVQTEFITIPPANRRTGGEQGLLGMAFDPQWPTNRKAFLSYTAPGGGPFDVHSQLSRFTSNDDGQTLDFSTEEVVLQVAQPEDNHKGGDIAFGPDGDLYYGLGDGGGENDIYMNGQNLDSLLGKMLRLDVSTLPYTIPADNPFASGVGGLPEIFAWGFRNPYRWSFDPATGELWAGDVGQDSWEEVDRVERGGNYGWVKREGAHCFPPGSSCTSGGLIDPVVEYAHTVPNVAIIGGAVYRGTAIPWLVGSYIFADYASGQIFGVRYDPASGAASPQLLVDAPFPIAGFGQGQDGEVYALEFGDPAYVYELVPAMSPPADPFPSLLSATGCFAPTADGLAPVSGLIPYDVNVGAFADGATTERYFALPDGQQLHQGSDGRIELPIGSMALETVSLGGKPIETRLLARHADGGWGGYSYEWNDSGTEASLLEAGKVKTVGGHEWVYPARHECLACHTPTVGGTLGFEIGQLHRDMVYPNGRLADQVATLDHLAFFDSPIGPTSSLPRLPTPTGTDPVESRARAYLHASCAGCHQPGGVSSAAIDLRFQTALASTGLCGVAPSDGDLRVPGAWLITPSQPGLSVLSLRMRTLDANRMVPLGPHAIDVAGADLIDAWISSLTACP